MKYSKYQSDIFKWVKNGEGSAVVQAVAGAGKTTTMVEASKKMSGKVVFLAFNKSIAEELKERGVPAATFHSLCFRTQPKSLLKTDKVRSLLRMHLEQQEFNEYAGTIARLIGLSKNMGVGVRKNYTISMVIDEYQIELPEQLLSVAETVFRKSVLDTNAIDFDDMLYNVVKHNLPLSKVDWCLVDELQDTNFIQLQIIKKLCKASTRVIGVGDVFQSIYGFRGASPKAMLEFKRMFKAKELPLSITYRCPVSVVEYSKQWNQDIIARDQAPMGLVQRLDKAYDVSDFKANDLVVSRLTAPVIKLAFKCLKNKIPVMVLGRDIGEGLKSLIKKHNKTGSLQDMLTELTYKCNQEFVKLMNQEKEAQAQSMRDKLDSILTLASELGPSGTIEDLNKTIDELFTDKNKAVKMSTIHKAKGLEANTVWWLDSHIQPLSWAIRPDDIQQEKNLCYVATTRAKETLNLIRSYND